MLPRRLAERSEYDTPTYPLLLSAGIILAASFVEMEEIIELLNFLYCLAELTEFAAFLWLRHTKPHLERPFKVPLSDTGCALGLLPAVLLLFLVMSLASWKTLGVAGGMIAVGLLAPWFLERAREQEWYEFEEMAFETDLDHVTPGEVAADEAQHSFDDAGGDVDEGIALVPSSARPAECTP